MTLDINSALAAVATSGFVVGIGIKFVGNNLGNLLAGKAHDLFEAVRGSEWVRDPKHPKRAKWFLATVELLEDELPEPGQGKEYYAWLAQEFVAAVARFKFASFLVGSERKWAEAFEKVGDRLDTECDQEIARIATGEVNKI